MPSIKIGIEQESKFSYLTEQSKFEQEHNRAGPRQECSRAEFRLKGRSDRVGLELHRNRCEGRAVEVEGEDVESWRGIRCEGREGNKWGSGLIWGWGIKLVRWRMDIEDLP
ncbi:hypothetical protein L6452_42482 [Arctium lappa]|uniref:Uncharacterized protein n=1 Tax=Arctium lappa TaxID=4217 RepID=A0ACB8XK48_ARCLA|nr:hypothetical protein L6452_42482 [Arctium lappa]